MAYCLSVISETQDELRTQGGVVEVDVMHLAPGNYVGANNTNVYLPDMISVVADEPGTIIDCEHLPAHERAFNLAVDKNPHNVTLDGFTVQNCVMNERGADGAGIRIEGLFGGSLTIQNMNFYGHQAADLGGAISILVSEITSVVIRNTTFSGNIAYSGAAIYVNGPTLVIDNCTFKNNTSQATGWGAAVYMQKVYPMQISNSIFQENRGDYGGCFFVTEASAIITDTVFIDNYGAQMGGVLWADAISAVVFQRCHFSGNNAEHVGGVIVGTSYSNIYCIDCTFVYSKCRDKGGVLWAAGTSSFEFMNTTFKFSSAELGGIFYITQYSGVRFDGCAISNSTALWGGTGYARDNATANLNATDLQGASYGDTTIGGAFYAEDSASVTLDDSTVSYHYAYQGGVVFLDDYASFQASNSTLRRNQAEQGGVIFLSTPHTAVALNNNSIMYNQAYKGGAIYSNGGIVQLQDPNATAFGSYFFQNRAMTTGGCRGVDGYGGVFYFSGMFDCDGVKTGKAVLIIDNYADTAGGISYFAEEPPLCAMNFWSDSVTSANEAPYGAESASVFKTLILLQIDDLVLSANTVFPTLQVQPGGQFPNLLLTVKDALGQQISGDHLSITVTATAMDTDVVLTEALQDVNDGECIFSLLQLFLTYEVELPRNVTINLTSDPYLNPVLINATLTCPDDFELQQNDDGMWACSESLSLAWNQFLALLILLGILAVCELICIFMIIRYLRRRVFTHPTASLLFLSGCGTMMAGMWFSIQQQNDLYEILKTFLVSLGLDIIIVTALVQDLHRYRYRDDPIRRSIPIAACTLLVGVAAILLLTTTAVALCVFSVRILVRHMSPQSIALVLIIEKVILLAVGLFFAYKARNVPSPYRESKHTTLLSMNYLIMFIAVALPVCYFAPDQSYREMTILIVTGLFYAAMSTIILIFGPKLYIILREEDRAPFFLSTSQGEQSSYFTDGNYYGGADGTSWASLSDSVGATQQQLQRKMAQYTKLREQLQDEVEAVKLINENIGGVMACISSLSIHAQSLRKRAKKAKQTQDKRLTIPPDREDGASGASNKGRDFRHVLSSSVSQSLGGDIPNTLISSTPYSLLPDVDLTTELDDQDDDDEPM